MNKFTDQFWKYALCLLIVGVVLVAVGGLSVGRTTMANKRELGFDMTYKEKVAAISKENMELKKENDALKTQNETLVTENESTKLQYESMCAYVRLEACMKKQDFENARVYLSQIDASSLPDDVKIQFEEFKIQLDGE